MTQITQTVAVDPKPAKGLHEYFRDDQIVVGIRYYQLVLDMLTKLGAEPQELEVSKHLGLALIGLNAPAALAGLKAVKDASVDTAIEQGIADANVIDQEYEPSPLDLVVRGLRAQFRAQNMGWAPTFGKNRIVGQVSGSYVIDGGGDGAPVAVRGDYVFGGGLRPADMADSPEPLVVPARAAAPGRGALVGLIDTPLDANPWLTGGFIAAAADMLPAHSAAPVPFAAGHATFIAGILLRQAPAAVVISRSALGEDGTADSWTVAKAIADLAGSGAQIINLSFGCYTDDGQPPLVLEAALASLSPETVVVAAAGNHGEIDGGDRPVWPAAFEDVIAVGALVDEGNGGRAKFTPKVQWLDAMAKGVGVVSTYLSRPVTEVPEADGGSGFAAWSGTSFAAAAVSGALASRVEPGHRSARLAWKDMQHEAGASGDLPVIKLRELGPPWDVNS